MGYNSVSLSAECLFVSFLFLFQITRCSEVSQLRRKIEEKTKIYPGSGKSETTGLFCHPNRGIEDKINHRDSAWWFHVQQRSQRSLISKNRRVVISTKPKLQLLKRKLEEIAKVDGCKHTITDLLGEFQNNWRFSSSTTSNFRVAWVRKSNFVCGHTTRLCVSFLHSLWRMANSRNSSAFKSVKSVASLRNRLCNSSNFVYHSPPTQHQFLWRLLAIQYHPWASHCLKISVWSSVELWKQGIASSLICCFIYFILSNIRSVVVGKRTVEIDDTDYM